MYTGKEESVLLFNAKNYQQVHEFKGHVDFVKCIAFSPDGKFLISCGMDQTVRFWNIAEKKQGKQFSITQGVPTAVCISPSGKYLVVATNMGGIYIWDVPAGKLIHEYNGHTDKIGQLRYSAIKDAFLTCSMDGTAKWWDSRLGSVIYEFKGHSAPVFGIALSKDSKIALTGSADKSVRVWDIATGKELFAPVGHIDNVHGLAISPNGRQLLSCGADHTLRLWAMAGGKQEKTWTDMDETYVVAFSPDNGKIAAANYSSIALLDRKGEKLGQLTGHKNKIRYLQFSEDGKYLYSAGWDGKLIKWEVSTMSLLSAIETGNSVESATINGNLIACGHWNGSISLWNANSGKAVHSFKAHDQVIKDLATIRQGKYLVSVSDDGTLKMWDSADFSPAGTLSVGYCKKMAVFPEKSIAILAVEGKKIVAWSLESMQKLYSVDQDSQPLYIAASYDEQGFVVGNGDGTIYLYRLK